MGKGSDRTFRSLRGLEKTASTSRVLNLAALSARNAGNPEHEKSPFFVASSLNGAVIVRHRLRDQERESFDRIRYTATKLIIPFERSDLGLGGRSCSFRNAAGSTPSRNSGARRRISPATSPCWRP